jgi:hypothetical protein
LTLKSDNSFAAELSESERRDLAPLGHLRAEPGGQSHIMIRAARWAGSRMGRFSAAFLAVLLWFSVVSQMVVTEFFNYHEGGAGFLNRPLIQLPFFAHIPAHLQNDSVNPFMPMAEDALY